jgi:hypothetical protein
VRSADAASVLPPGDGAHPMQTDSGNSATQSHRRSLGECAA